MKDMSIIANKKIINKETNEVRLVEEKKAAAKPKVKMQPRRDAPRRELNLRSAESEVDVRGMSAEEALFEVDNFLSRALPHCPGQRSSRWKCR